MFCQMINDSPCNPTLLFARFSLLFPLNHANTYKQSRFCPCKAVHFRLELGWIIVSGFRFHLFQTSQTLSRRAISHQTGLSTERKMRILVYIVTLAIAVLGPTQLVARVECRFLFDATRCVELNVERVSWRRRLLLLLLLLWRCGLTCFVSFAAR